MQIYTDQDLDHARLAKLLGCQVISISNRLSVLS